jgi:16S rRNA (guanine527-N7)-methyltransferase
MDEDAAKAWLADLGVSRETQERMDRLVAMLREENAHQNLVSAASLDHVYGRHIVDSAQLWRLAPDAGSWLDLGSGAGLPGLVLAILTDAPVILVESRRLRADWLQRAADALRLDNVRIEASRLELVPDTSVDVITARAFAPLPRLFALAHRFSHGKTCWILPKGRSAAEELASVATTWHGSFRMEPSVTDPDSAIIVARGVKPRSTTGGARL